MPLNAQKVNYAISAQYLEARKKYMEPAEESIPIAAERDAALAEVERLRGEVTQLQNLRLAIASNGDEQLVNSSLLK